MITQPLPGCYLFHPVGKSLEMELFEELMQDRLIDSLIKRDIYKSKDGKDLYELNRKELEALYKQSLVGEKIGQAHREGN